MFSVFEIMQTHKLKNKAGKPDLLDNVLEQFLHRNSEIKNCF